MQITEFLTHLFNVSDGSFCFALLLLLVGIFFVYKGGDLFVEASSNIAGYTGIPKVVLGATLVSFATTLPELLVSAFAAKEGEIDMAVSNAVGSVNANYGLILSLSFLTISKSFSLNDLKAKGALLLLITSALFAFSQNAKLSFLEGTVLLVLAILFFYENLKSSKKETAFAEEVKQNSAPMQKKVFNGFLFLLGAMLLAIGADLMVDNAVTIAKFFGISEAVIGVTVLSFGTALPEFVTAISAMRKGETELSIGNILGANCIDLTLILPICSLISHVALPIPTVTYLFSLPFALLFSIFTMLAILFPKINQKILGLFILLFYVLLLSLHLFLPTA